MARVLLVDDAEFMRARCARILVEQGHEVVEASNGQEAVEVYERTRPDVVLMDITMPVMDGIAATREIRSRDPRARVVICTALGQQAMVMEAVKAGACDFIVKPFQPDRVATAVQRFAAVG